MHIQHILVPMDFSSDAEHALEQAIELAKQFQARLTLMNVMYFPVVADVNLVAYYGEIETGAKQGIADYEERAKEAGLSVDTVIVSGTPFREIVETAKTQQVDLIVMGTHGRTGMHHMLIGSVAERVVRLAPCPVMVTRGTRTQAAA